MIVSPLKYSSGDASNVLQVRVGDEIPCSVIEIVIVDDMIMSVPQTAAEE